jgi:hypothetical protein
MRKITPKVVTNSYCSTQYDIKNVLEEASGDLNSECGLTVSKNFHENPPRSNGIHNDPKRSNRIRKNLQDP